MAFYINKEVQTEEILLMKRKLNLNSSDLFSTPPSELRREISHLRSEICETHEFHDLEIKILQEEHNIADSKNDITIAELQKSLQNAENIIVDSKKEISNLKTVIQELQEQLKEELNKSSNLKEEYEHKISELQLTLRKKNFEIEKLEKDKTDCEFCVQLLQKNYERKIDELRIALEHSREKNNGNERNSFNVSEIKLNKESDKEEELHEIRCTFEEEIKKLKDEHNNTLKSFELINEHLKQTNESLTEKLREANETVEGLREQLRILQNKTELPRSPPRITEINDSAGEIRRDDLETSDGRIANSLSDKRKPETVRKEFEGYKVSENKNGLHFVQRTVRYLGALCSQLEESGSSLNLSSLSFDSFNEDLPSSTLMEDFTEVEISAANDATVCNDPLALTRDNTLQTPFKTQITAHKNRSKTDFKTPLNSVSKPLRMPFRTPIGNAKNQIRLTTPGVTACESDVNETELLQLQTSLAMTDKEICDIKDIYVKKISLTEEILANSLKDIFILLKALEERILRLENISAKFKLEKEMSTAENCNGKEPLGKHVEEMDEIRRKLIVEITSLNPQLEGTLTDVCVSTLLNMFLNSIMESCNKMPEKLSQKFLMEIKALNEKIEMYEGKLFESEKEIDRLNEVNAALLIEKDETEKEMTIQHDKIRVLRLESSELQSLRVKVKDLEERLEKSDKSLKTEEYLKETTVKDIQKLKKFFENIENDNHDLKVKLERADKTIEELNFNLMRARKEHLCVVTKEELAELQGDEEPLNTLESILDKYKKAEISMRTELEALNSKITACETELTAKEELIKTIIVSHKEANKAKLECEEIISKLKEKLADVEQENTTLKSLKSVLKEYEDKEKLLSVEIEILNSRLKSTEVELKEKTEFVSQITAQVKEAKNIKEKDGNIISELRAQVKEFESTVERMVNENGNLSEKVKNLSSDLVVCKANVEEKSEVISRMMSEIEQAGNDKKDYEGIISELRAEVEKLEKETTRLREFESTFEKLKEIECDVSERMEVLNSRLLICESDFKEKLSTINRLRMEVEEARKIKIEHNKVILDLRLHIEEIEREKVKAEELRLIIENLKDREKVLSEKVKDLSARLAVTEVALSENLQLIAEKNLKLEKAECSNTENMEIITELKKQLKNLENEKTKVEELQCTVKNLKVNEKILLEKVEDLSLKIKSAEEKKRELELKIFAEMEETSKTKAKNDEIMELLRLTVESFDCEKTKLEEFEAAMVKLKEKEKVMTERIENLNSRLLASEEVLNEKTQTLAQMRDEIAEAKLIKEKNDNTISALQAELEVLRNLRSARDAAYHERNEKETLIEDLHNKLNELNTEIECLREKLGQAESNLKLHEEKVVRLGEMENDLIAYKKFVDGLKVDCDKMKELENYLFKVTNEFEKRNKELEGMNNDLLQKNIDYEKLNENNSNEIKLLRESLSSAQDKLKLNKEKSEKLLTRLEEMEEEQAEMRKAVTELNSEVTELRKFKSENSKLFRDLEHEKEILMQNLKEIQEGKNEMVNTILNVATKLDHSLSDGDAGTTEWLNLVVEKLDKLLLSHNEEMESLRQEVKSCKEIINNLQTEIDNYNRKSLNESKSESFVKPREIFFEKITPLKSTPVIGRSRVDVSPPHKSRRLEKLENLNDLLNGTLQKIITALNIPVNVNFFSVDCYESNETQVMKYITSLKFIKNDVSQLSETRNETNITSEMYEDMRRIVNELKTCLSTVVKYLGLAGEVSSSHEIISQIEEIKREEKAGLLERIALLRQDNQHLDDDNNLLQRKTKELVDIVTSNKIKISALEKCEELLKADCENLRIELLKYQGKSKINRKNDLCNRKLDRLEELHQSLVDLLKKILTMMEMENVHKLNLFTPRTFDIESRKIFDHVNNWMLKKSNEIQELKSQVTELDEECESYAKKIKEDSQQIYKAWEEVRTLELEKGKLEEEVKLLKCDLKNLQADGKPVSTSDTGTDWKKEMENLKEKNISLKAHITALNNELDQSKKQREELDEECESLAIAVKQEGEQRVKIWEDFQKELKILNDRIEELEKEKKCLESEKEDLAKEIKAKESGTNDHSPDVKEGLKCNCQKQSKELKELQSAIVVREMRILELEQLNEKNVVRKTQMKALENSLSAIKKKLAEENEVNQKLQAEIKELSNQKGSQESEILGKLRMRDYGIAAVNQIEEREKLQKLEKDNRMLKELCRTRYNEIKRLETENLSLKGHERMTKNSNQMDSPIRTRAYNKTLKRY